MVIRRQLILCKQSLYDLSISSLIAPTAVLAETAGKEHEWCWAQANCSKMPSAGGRHTKAFFSRQLRSAQAQQLDLFLDRKFAFNHPDRSNYSITIKTTIGPSQQDNSSSYCDSLNIKEKWLDPCNWQSKSCQHPWFKLARHSAAAQNSRWARQQSEHFAKQHTANADIF